MKTLLSIPIISLRDYGCAPYCCDYDYKRHQKQASVTKIDLFKSVID